MEADAPQSKRPEAWVVLAWLVLVGEFALAVYLGMKRPGVGPVKAFVYGPWLLAAAALAVGATGLVWSLRHRPFGHPQRLIAFGLLAFVVGTATYGLPFPAARGSRPSAARVRVPAAGEWTVAWGGLDEANALLRTRPDRCFGYYLVLARDGVTRADAADPRSAFAFGAEVLAPAAGAVVRAVNDVPDDGQWHADDLGNHVVIEVAAGEYLFVSGLAQGSVTVAAGQRVAAGDALGRVGYSAFSPLLPEPHLALHLQDTPDPLWGQGIPFYFYESAVDGERVARAAPTGRGYFPGRALTGQRVAHAP